MCLLFLESFQMRVHAVAADLAATINGPREIFVVGLTFYSDKKSSHRDSSSWGVQSAILLKGPRLPTGTLTDRKSELA